MKSLEEIEKLDRLRLGEIAHDTSIKVPDGLGRTTGEMLDALDRARGLADGGMSLRTKRTVASIAAGLVLVVGIGLASHFSPEAGPADTFDDPYLAYAQVQESFGRIGRAMKSGVDRADEGVESFSKPVEIVKKSLNH